MKNQNVEHTEAQGSKEDIYQRVKKVLRRRELKSEGDKTND